MNDVVLTLSTATGASVGSSVGAVGAFLQRFLTTTISKMLVSLMALVVLLAVALAIRAYGRPLKEQYDEDDVEAVQAVAFSIAAVVTAWFLTVVWRLAGDVQENLARVRIGPQQAVLALVAVVTLTVAYTLTRVSKGLLERRSGDVITAHRREVIHHVVQLTVYGIALAFVLSLAGIQPRNLLVGAGVLGLVVGLAARQTLGAILAGLVLIFARPFTVGDWVVVDEREGVVTDVTLFNTELRTYDDEHVLIPNDEVAQSNIVNRSRSGRLRISVDVGVDYDVDVSRAAEVAEQALRECDSEPKLDQPTPTVVGKAFSDSAVTLECRFWISNPSAPRKWQAQTDVIEAVKDAFAAEGIKIPFPQRELTGREEAAGLRLGADGAATADGGEAGGGDDGADGADTGGSDDGSRDADHESDPTDPTERGG